LAVAGLANEAPTTHPLFLLFYGRVTGLNEQRNPCRIAALRPANSTAGATVRITFADARKGVRELDLTDAEAEQLGGRAVARRGRRPKSQS
jgi:hypothetical protein